MNLILGFAPYIVFIALIRLSPSLALWAAFAAAFAISIRDFVETGELKLLDTGSLALFGLLALYAGFIQPSMGSDAIRLAVDLAILFIIAGSAIMRRPFSLKYARHPAAAGVAEGAVARIHAVITGVWITAFLVMAAMDATVIVRPSFPPVWAALGGFVVLGAAIAFSLRYPRHLTRARQH